MWLTFADLDLNGELDGIGRLTSKTYGIAAGIGRGMFEPVTETVGDDFRIPEMNLSSVVWMDYNKDGLPDYVNPTSLGNVLINRGNFRFDALSVSFSNRKRASDPEEEAYQPWSMAYLIDLNHDGILDGIHHESWIYLSDSSCHAIGMEFRADVIPADVNKDGWVDLVGWVNSEWFGFYKDLYINNGDGTFTSKELFPAGGDNTDYRERFAILAVEDLNSDGWVDLIQEYNDSILMISPGAENGTFNKKNVVFMHLPKEHLYSSLLDIRDLDNNGYPDLIYYGLDNEYHACLLNADLKPICQFADYTRYTMYPFADLNGDGAPDTNVFDSDAPVPNSAPDAPAHVETVTTSKGVTVTWEAASDQETPSAQLRYNLSVKRKGHAVGKDNAFLVSPMNGLKDHVPVVPDCWYNRATCYTIPASQLTEGEEYEVQVQAIDLWSSHSPFSEVCTFVYHAVPEDDPKAIDHVTDEPTPVKLLLNGQFFIRRGEQTYTLQGQEVN
jgi:hypothetical protein